MWSDRWIVDLESGVAVVEGGCACVFAEEDDS